MALGWLSGVFFKMFQEKPLPNIMYIVHIKGRHLEARPGPW